MNPLYPPGLDENRAVDDLYTASWICSEIALLHRKCIYLLVRHVALSRKVQKNPALSNMAT